MLSLFHYAKDISEIRASSLEPSSDNSADSQNQYHVRYVTIAIY